MSKYRCLLLLLTLISSVILIRVQRSLYYNNSREAVKIATSTHTNYKDNTIGSSDCTELKDNRLRIALIKPDAVLGLYHSGYGDETVFIQRASMHWGPIGLFHSEYFLTDYYIIKTDHADISTSQWVEPLIDCIIGSAYNTTKSIKAPKRPKEGYLVTGVSRSSSINITKSAILPGSIPWHEYDIVLSYSPAVSSEVISKYPSTIWAYWIVEGCQRSYIQSRKGKLVHGWDLFLTQDFNLYTNLPSNVVEFPLIFDYHGGLVDLLGLNTENHTQNMQNYNETQKNVHTMRSGILLLPSNFNSHEKNILEHIEYLDLNKNISKRVTITELQGTTPYSMNLHTQKKYAVVWNRTSRGNALAEAWSGGLLVLGHVHDRIINQEILRISGCEFQSVELLAKKIIEFERNEELFSNYLLQQQKLFDMLAFYGPLRELIVKGFKKVEHKLYRAHLHLPDIHSQRMRKPVNIFASWHSQNAKKLRN